MTINRIASDEPDLVGIVPQPITFWYRGTQYQAGVSVSAMDLRRFARDYGGNNITFQGDSGRLWLADPCSAALHEHLQQDRWDQDTKARADRFARRQAKAALEQERIQASSGKARRR